VVFLKQLIASNTECDEEGQRNISVPQGAANLVKTGGN